MRKLERLLELRELREKALIGPQLISPLSPYFHEIIKIAWNRAKELANRSGGLIESIKPDHLYGDEGPSIGYVLKVGELYPGNTLPEKVYLVIYGIYNNDDTLDYIQLSDGYRTIEWFVQPVYYYTEKIGVWGEGPIILRASSAKIYVHSLDSNKDRVNAWLLGYVIKPRETQITQTTQTGRRGRRSRTRTEKVTSESEETSESTG